MCVYIYVHICPIIVCSHSLYIYIAILEGMFHHGSMHHSRSWGALCARHGRNTQHWVCLKMGAMK